MAASSFPTALREVLRWEGGFVNDPRDPGHETNLGITIGTAKAFGLDMDDDGDVDVQDVRLLTPEAAGKVYKAHYWDAIRGDDLPAGVDLITFDCAVNSGPKRAAKFLQRAVQVKEDGDIGPLTLKAVAGFTPRSIIEVMRLERDIFYRSLPTFKHFGRGWLNRLGGVYARSMALAGRS